MGKAETVRDAVRLAADALLTATLAPRCAACTTVLDRPCRGAVCDVCWSLVQPLRPPLCRTCGDPLPSWRVVSVAAAQCARCRRTAGHVDAGAAAGSYEGALREIIHAFKYEGRRSLAAPLGSRMREAGGGLLEGARCAVPVPLHPWRRVQRGFNQAAELAATLDLPVVHALWRARWTAPQAGLTASARRRNVRRAFRVSPLMTPRTREAWLAGAVVLLVDDVRTTGATLNACAEVLKHAGASEVKALTAAVRAYSRADSAA
jgi:ComF family protein